MPSSALRGYNGNLIVGKDGVLIRRGLRGVLARKRRESDLRIRFDEVAAVRFAPSGWLVGRETSFARQGQDDADDDHARLREFAGMSLELTRGTAA